MKLSKDQVELLKAFRKQEGFKLLEHIADNITNQLGRGLLNADLSNEKDIEVIKKNQLYIKAMNDFLKNTEKLCQEIYSPKV